MLELTDDPYTNRLLRASKASNRIKGIDRLIYRGPALAVMHMTGDRSKAVRRNAVAALTSLDEGLGCLIKLLGSNKEDVRESSVDALLDLAIDNEDEVVSCLLSTLDAECTITRNCAVSALSHISPTPAIPQEVFINLLGDSCEDLVINALLGLIKYGCISEHTGTPDLSQLRTLLNSENECIVINTFNVLGAFGEQAEEFLPDIARFLTGEDSLITMAAEKAEFLIKKEMSQPVRGARRAAQEVRNHVINTGLDEISVRKLGRIIQQKSGMDRNIHLCNKVLKEIRQLVIEDPSLLEKGVSKIIKDINNAIAALKI